MPTYLLQKQKVIEQSTVCLLPCEAATIVKLFSSKKEILKVFLLHFSAAVLFETGVLNLISTNNCLMKHFFQGLLWF